MHIRVQLYPDGLFLIESYDAIEFEIGPFFLLFVRM